jgi:MoaA/NifB/PqqE/SkfB family radical SAM enzyme
MIAMKNSIPILPKSVALELTYRCNHHCLFCSCPWYAPNSSYPLGKELSTTQWKWVIEKLYDYGVKTFSFSGGEALLREDLHEIIRHIRTIGNQRKIDYPIILISNGRLMNEEHLKFFKEMNVHLSMSLPGYQSFEEHTGVANADYVLEYFSKAKEIGLECTANITVTKKNYYELFETISLALINGATEILLNRFLPGGRGLKYIPQFGITNSI